ncbi:MAG: ABC transporter permease [Deltaproteobacteria bacterium]|nr:ABC transporter permease [Deltaproteobacteria bacterium]
MKIQKPIEPFFWLTFVCSSVVVAFILLPLIQMIVQPSFQDLRETLRDPDVRRSIWLSVYTSGLAAFISFTIGTPFAYLLARKDFLGKRFVESIIDLPIMIPHPVVGIAILGIAGKNHWLGHLMHQVGIHVMGTVTGIVAVLTFVGLPFYVNTVKAGFEAIPVRLENVSRSFPHQHIFARDLSPCVALHPGRDYHVLCKSDQRIWSRYYRGLSPHDRTGDDL